MSSQSGWLANVRPFFFAATCESRRPADRGPQSASTTVIRGPHLDHPTGVAARESGISGATAGSWLSTLRLGWSSREETKPAGTDFDLYISEARCFEPGMQGNRINQDHGVADVEYPH